MPSLLLGMDIGATKISTGLVSPRGVVRQQKKSLTEVAKGKQRVLGNIFSAIASYPRSSFSRIGIGIMGSVDWKRGISGSADKLPRGWHNVPLAALISRRLHKPASVNNDANAFALGATWSKGKKYSAVVGITLGSGIGGGFVINGKVYHGKDDWVSEFGHTVIDLSSAIRCACGHYGHFEALAGGWGMSRQYARLTGKRLSAQEIEHAYRQGDTSARKVFRLMSRALGAGLANIVATHNPDVIYIGGGLSRFHPYVQAGIREMKNLLEKLPPHGTHVILVHNPEAANIRGAALLAYSRHHSA